MPQEGRDQIEMVRELEQFIAQSRDGQAHSAEAVATFLRLLRPENTAYTVSHLSEDDRTAMLSSLSECDPDFAADLLEHFVDEQAADMIEQLEPDEAAAIVDEMDSDEQVDVLAEMDEDDFSLAGFQKFCK